MEQLQPQAGQTEVSGVIMGLMRLQTRLLQLGEERLNSGLLSAIGLGKRSPVSTRYLQEHFIRIWDLLKFISQLFLNFYLQV